MKNKAGFTLIRVIKKFNKIEEFNPQKIFQTCLRAGATEKLAQEVTNEVSKKVYDGITTKEILSLVIKTLKKMNKSIAARYNLKDSLIRLGPTGYPFENFVGKLLENYNYRIKLRQLIKGKCAVHEIDVLAEKNENGVKKRAIIEVKFRHSDEIYIGLKHVLYTYARFLDINEGYKLGKSCKVDEVWLVCNTKASEDAVKYAVCNGLKLITWNFPHNHGLRDMLEEKNLYPITIMKTISKKNLIKFYESNIVFVKDLLECDPKLISRKFNISRDVIKKIYSEANRIHDIKNKKRKLI
ncbi:MAG: ATP cone domain-containing protein [Candidatus Odinarchaeia archaeon]